MQRACRGLAVAFTVAITGAAAGEVEPGEVYQRTLILGTSDRVVTQAESQPRGHAMSVLLSDYTQAEVRSAPSACGLQLAKHYRRSLRDDFDVIALSTCRESPTQVDCPSEKFEDTGRLFLRLRYSLKQQEMELQLAAFSLDSLGNPVEIQVNREHKFAFGDLWDELSALAYCSP